MPRGDFADDNAFRQQVATDLRSLLDQLDEVDADELDPMLTPGTLTIRFESGATYVLSQQTPTHELWLSAELQAWHFVHEDGVWVERDTGEPMTELLGTLISKRLGEPVQLRL